MKPSAAGKMIWMLIVCLFPALAALESRAASPRVSTPAKDPAAAAVKNAGPMKNGMAVGADKRTLDVLSTWRIESTKPVPQTVNAPAQATAPPVDQIEQAKQILARMVESLNRRNVDGLFNPVASTARLSLKGRATDVGNFRRSISSALPFLTNLVWDAQVVSAVRDPKSGAVRIRVRSTYSAKLAEPIGVTSASLAKPTELVSAQKRVTEAFNKSGEEIYEFTADSSKPLRVTEIVSALPLDAALMDRVAAMGAQWDVKVAVFGLFYYIEQNDLGKFGWMIGSDFVNNDDNGFKSNKTDFLESAKADLDHLTAIDHSVRVDDIQMNGDRTQARVPVTWDRRARISNTKSEWVVKSQKTTMTLRRAAGLGFGLAQIEGNPLFGNSSRMTRKTLIRTGEVDAVKVTKAIVISDARDTGLATSADFPEMPSELISTLGLSSEVSGGSISSNPSVDQTWKGNITITTSITIPSGITITATSATLSIADNATITVNGTLTATSTTFKKSSSGWSGLVIASGSAVTLSSCTLQDADTLILITAASPTIQNSNLYPNKCALNIRSSGSPVISGNAITSGTGSRVNAAALIVEPSSSANIAFTSNTVSKLGQTAGYAENMFGFLNYTGTFTSSSNRFTGEYPTVTDHNAYSVRAGSAGTFTFTRDVFTAYESAIENDGPASNRYTDAQGANMTITNCDFTANKTAGVSGGDVDANGTPNIRLIGCHFKGNGGQYGTNTVSSATNVPDEDGTPTNGAADAGSQYEDVTSVTSPAASANN